MATKLKPCPFCGSTNVGVCDIGSGFTVQCWQKTCRAMGPIVDYEDIRQTRGASGRKLKGDAARRWNTRSVASAEATIREANGEARP